MHKYLLACFFLFASGSLVFAQSDSAQLGKKDPVLTQYYSGDFGFYSPSGGLNNGLLLGIDGITEFNRYDFFLSGDIDLYYKKTIDIFSSPKPDISDQTIFLLPLHVNFGYKLADIPDAGTRFYVGGGVGYYLYFYNVTYSGSSGGGVLGGGGLVGSTDDKSGGNLFATVFARVLIGKVFVEPRYYIAASKSGNTGGYNFTINPTGFAIKLGFQYGK